MGKSSHSYLDNINRKVNPVRVMECVFSMTNSARLITSDTENRKEFYKVFYTGSAAGLGYIGKE